MSESSSMRPSVESVRRSIADALDRRIGGAEARQRTEAVLSAPGPRWFPADSPVRTVHTDISMLVGGIRAILLQSLHPLAMAGVAEHSNYRSDPWGRLQRTADFLGVVSFGPAEWAERSIETVRAVHSRVRGTASNGRPYAADDPHLLRWVHVVELDSFLGAYRMYGETPLSPADEDRYVSEMARVAEALGATAVPRSTSELDASLADYRTELRSTKEARSAARYLAIPPGLSAAERIGYAPLFSGAVALLPVRARILLGLVPWMPITERFVVRPVTATALGVGRWSRPDRPTVADSSSDTVQGA
jgi:uncharacterized protein (DUF2236 family)